MRKMRISTQLLNTILHNWKRSYSLSHSLIIKDEEWNEFECKCHDELTHRN